MGLLDSPFRCVAVVVFWLFHPELGVFKNRGTFTFSQTFPDSITTDMGLIKIMCYLGNIYLIITNTLDE